MTMRKNRIILTFTILLLCFSFVSTPITALATNGAKEAEKENLTQTDESRTDTQKEPPITTNGEEFYIEEETPTEEWFGEESASNSSTRGNDEIVNTTYLEDGVYAFRNVGNGSSLWMDLQQNIISSSAHIQQCNYTTPPTELFERAALFKVTRIGSTNRYIIRLMMNNLLTFDFVGNSVMTKRIPANDSEVNSVDTFIIIKTELGYTIGPADTSYSVCANSTTASGAAGAPDSYLIKSTVGASGNCAKWEIHKYTGVARSGYSASASPSFTNGLTVGNTSTITMYSWSTIVGANKPSIEVSSAFSSRVSVTDITSSSGFSGKFRLSALKAGRFKLAYQIKNASNTNSYNTYSIDYIVIPRISLNSSAYIRNIGTDKYIDIEGPSLSEGAFIQQWQFNRSRQSKWILRLEAGGYISIQSIYSGMYIGVDSASTNLIRQYGTINDYTLWRFEETDSGYYKLLCKGISGTSVLGVPSINSGNGVNLTRMTYTADTNFNDEWMVYNESYGVVNYYDDSLATNTAYVQTISDANTFLSTAFSDFFDVNIFMSGSASFWNDAYTDECLHQNTACDASCGANCRQDHHKNLYRILDMMNTVERKDNHAIVMWMNRAGGSYCINLNGVHNVTEYEQSIAVTPLGFPLIEMLSIDSRLHDPNWYHVLMKIALVHEMTHCFGYSDVYNTAGHYKDDGQYECIMDCFEEKQIYQLYNQYAIYGQSLFCDSCLTGIEAMLLQNEIMEGN